MDLFNKLKTHKEIILIVLVLLIPLYLNYFNITLGGNNITLGGNNIKSGMVSAGAISDIETPNFLVSDASGSITTFTIPKGTIVMFNKGSSLIPTGWAMCDGNNGTPDLRGRFVLGSNPVGNLNTKFKVNDMSTPGGTETKTLTVAEMPAHTHTFSNASKTERKGYSASYNNSAEVVVDINYPTSTTSSTGGSVSFDMRPPYYVLTYIMKII